MENETENGKCASKAEGGELTVHIATIVCCVATRMFENLQHLWPLYLCP